MKTCQPIKLLNLLLQNMAKLVFAKPASCYTPIRGLWYIPLPYLQWGGNSSAALSRDFLLCLPTDTIFRRTFACRKLIFFYFDFFLAILHAKYFQLHIYGWSRSRAQNHQKPFWLAHLYLQLGHKIQLKLQFVELSLRIITTRLIS